MAVFPRCSSFSPVAHLENSPAGLDSPEINRSVQLFVGRMMASNGDVNLVSHPLGRHGFEILDDDQQTRDTIAASVAFAKSRLARLAPSEAKAARTGRQLQVLLAGGRIALEALLWAVDLAPASPNAHDSLATGYEARPTATPPSPPSSNASMKELARGVS